MGLEDLSADDIIDPLTGQSVSAGEMAASAHYLPYDFQRPTTLAREHSRILDVACDTFARQWSSQMTTRLRTKTAVTPVLTVLATYDTYTASLPATTCMMLLHFAGTETRGIVQMPIETAADWVSRMLGSDGESLPAHRDLTGTEIGVLRRTMSGVMEDLAYSFTGVLDAAPVLELGVHYNPGFVQAAAPTDLMIVAAFVVTTGSGAPESFTLTLPADIILPRLGSSNPVDTDQDAPRLAMEQLTATPVEVRLETNALTINSMDLLKLAVGDILPLTHTSNRPFNLTVDGQHLATAVDVVDGSRKYMKIVETELDQ
ncbi:flagellar motor switch protein FliM [Citricoccus sp.]|uniref:flagellar motor switch protein FliM n=1 Tax=Citricoccus sp. TaxID=1978372 RepID=UPI0028BD9C58|nr:flagellar motor switch protein FliM [Citricoccus sp.]